MSKLLTIVYSAYMNFDGKSKTLVGSWVTTDDKQRSHCLKNATAVYRLLCGPMQTVTWNNEHFDGLQIVVLGETDIHYEVVTKLLVEAFEQGAKITFKLRPGEQEGHFQFSEGSAIYVHQYMGRSYTRSKGELLSDPALRVSPDWFKPFVPVRCPVGMPAEHNARHAMARN